MAQEKLHVHLGHCLEEYVRVRSMTANLKDQVKKELSRVISLAEQCTAIQKVTVDGLKVSKHFPDVTDKLRVKISSELFEATEALNNTVEQLRQDLNTAISHWLDTIELLRQHPEELNEETLMTGTPTSAPPGATLEMMKDRMNMLHNCKCATEFVVANPTLADLQEQERLLSQWMDNIMIHHDNCFALLKHHWEKFDKETQTGSDTGRTPPKEKLREAS